MTCCTFNINDCLYLLKTILFKLYLLRWALSVYESEFTSDAVTIDTKQTYIDTYIIKRDEFARACALVNDSFTENTWNKMDLPLMECNFLGKLRDLPFPTQNLAHCSCKLKLGFWEILFECSKVICVYLQGGRGNTQRKGAGLFSDPSQ